MISITSWPKPCDVFIHLECEAQNCASKAAEETTNLEGEGVEEEHALYNSLAACDFTI
jgi:hypothetical protein